jgi:peptide/nickel transport system substrate-binding protein
MKKYVWSRLIFVFSLLLALLPIHSSVAQQHGGILKIYHWSNPASMSIHEEGGYSPAVTGMAVFNNLVLYDQHVPQNSLGSIVPELANEWSWNADQTVLSFRLRPAVKWHDDKPFTAADVKCTWDTLLGKTSPGLRLNPRRAWYHNLREVTTEGGDEVSFHLARPQPAFIALLAAGVSPVYPCHVTPAQMRQHPIGTGPFKFVEFKPNESIKLTRNPNYWKEGRPYLDGIEYTIIPNRSTAILGFVAGRFDMTFPFQVSIPLLNEVKSQAPQAQCELAPLNATRDILINRTAAPFDEPKLRRAVSLTLDRKSFIDILAEGQASIGGAMMPPPEGVWGMPREKLNEVVGYGADVEKNRTEARTIMQGLGYGPDNRLKLKLSTRNVPPDRDSAVLLGDQLKEIFIDADLEPIENANWFPTIIRNAYTIGLNTTPSSVDDPDQQFYENYACKSENNLTRYCNPELQKRFDEQSMEVDQKKRKQLVWEIDKRLQEDEARPIIYHIRSATCWHPNVRGLTIMINSLFNGWRFEDVWLTR